ncbi:hypothetical protein [Desulfosporosinus sp. OT]|uniref:hypothetical protein n=1 Tax=Desulfosporosinus sp. OT TaxID=913865 RepID=UPI000223B2E5|nr:hypothetical protein [Desulfosporosinus sp. OT]EGW36050.1 phage-specific recombinase/integrase XerD domain protein [Desulfosporosinus sp. OT]
MTSRDTLPVSSLSTFPVRKMCSHTIAAYRDTFKLFLTYCETCKGLAPERFKMVQLTKEFVLGFLEWIETERGCSLYLLKTPMKMENSVFLMMLA